VIPRSVPDTLGLLDKATELDPDDLKFPWRSRPAVAADLFAEHAGHVSFAAQSSNGAQALIAAATRESASVFQFVKREWSGLIS